MTQLGVGQISLPIIGIHEPSLSGGEFSREIHQVFWKAINETEIGRSIVARLNSDERVKLLNQQMISSGSGASRMDGPNQLAMWWLWHANNVGEEKANIDLEHFLEADTIAVRAVLWVYGVTPSAPINFHNEIEFLHIKDIPDCHEKEEFLRTNFRFGNHGPPAPQAALFKTIKVKKIAPSLTIDGTGSEIDDHSKQLMRAFQDLSELAVVLNCVDNVCCFPGLNTTHLPAGTPLGPFSGSGGGTTLYDVLPRRTTQLHPGNEKLVAFLSERFSITVEPLKTTLARALFRFAQAKGRVNDGDRALDIGIALEMLLLNESHRDQLSLQFRLRGSWLIGEDNAERKAIHDDLKHIYELRSQLAHNGYSKELDKIEYETRQKILGRHTQIAERIFQKLIVDGRPPDWTSLILGTHNS
jgi:hypothetical protein